MSAHSLSSGYATEPQTSGKILMKTSIGDFDIELWSKQCPLACRNFIQLCMEGYYNETTFHRIIRDFMAQGGDPTATGSEIERFDVSSLQQHYFSIEKITSFSQRCIVWQIEVKEGKAYMTAPSKMSFILGWSSIVEDWSRWQTMERIATYRSKIFFSWLTAKLRFHPNWRFIRTTQIAMILQKPAFAIGVTRVPELKFPTYSH